VTTTSILLILAAVLIIAAAAYLLMRQRSLRLRSRFGPEYTRAVEETGNKYKAEARLEKLEKRVDKFSIQPLSPADAERFRDSWRVIQAGFVDDPRTALGDADRLIEGVMSARGYPVADFDERAAEISANHPLVVEHYRAGHHIAQRHKQGLASTEEMRQAMIHYRTLFEELSGDTEKVRAKGAGGRL